MTPQSSHQPQSIGVFYLARGCDADALTKFSAFRNSYVRFSPGMAHGLSIIYKGFRAHSELLQAQEIFSTLATRSIYTDDDSFDLGAYFQAAGRSTDEVVLFLNTASEIRGVDWLAKLAVNLCRPGVGMVSCSSSYEAPQHAGHRNLLFPNPHLRSNAFMIRRDRFLSMRPAKLLRDKIDVHLLEHGSESLTRRIEQIGLQALLVGRNGRAYEPRWWPDSQTFRQGRQENLLVADNQTKTYDAAPLPLKQKLHHLTWGTAAMRDLTVSRLLRTDG